MPANIDIFDTYRLVGIAQEVKKVPSFFKNRYFGNEVTFHEDKVLIEIEDSNDEIALFVDEHAGDIASSRGGYEVHEIAPSLIAPSRHLTLDDLKKRGFGEPLITGTSKEDRATALQVKDLSDLNKKISIREEWMVAQLLANYGFEMQEYIDADTVGKKKIVKFYEGANNPTAYSVGGDYWTSWAKMKAHILAMCDSLAENSRECVDLVLGSEVWAAAEQFEDFLKLLDTKSVDVARIREEIAAPGVTLAGILNVGGYVLNVFVPREGYKERGSNQVTRFFDSKAAMVIAPNCGQMLYASVTQIPQGETEYVTFEGSRIPKLIVDDKKDERKLALKSRPIAAPNAVAPWRYCAQVLA